MAMARQTWLGLVSLTEAKPKMTAGAVAPSQPGSGIMSDTGSSSRVPECKGQGGYPLCWSSQVLSVKEASLLCVAVCCYLIS